MSHNGEHYHEHDDDYHVHGWKPESLPSFTFTTIGQPRLITSVRIFRQLGVSKIYLVYCVAR
jgi:hypothetical protein